MKYEMSYYQGLNFQNLVQILRSRSGKNCWYPQIGLITRDTLVKFQSSSTHCSKVNSKDNIIKNMSNSNVTGSKILVPVVSPVTRNTHVKY